VERNHQANLQLHYKDLGEAQALANRLTVFISTRLCQPFGQRPEAPFPREEVDVQSPDITEATNTTSQSIDSGPGQQKLGEIPAASPRVAEQVSQEEPQQTATVDMTVKATEVRKGILLHHHTDATKIRTPYPGDFELLQMPAREGSNPIRKPLPKRPVAHQTPALDRSAHVRMPSPGGPPSPQMSFPARPAPPRIQSPQQIASPYVLPILQPVPIRHHATERIIALRSPSPEHSATTDLHREYREAKAWLISTQKEFDNRERRRDRETEVNELWLEQSGGTYGMPPEDFDLQWVKKISNLTRKLMNAEAAFQSARSAAVDGGCEVSDSGLNTVSDDDQSDSYPSSVEEIRRVAAPVAMIEGWRSSNRAAETLQTPGPDAADLY
jgi:hypothetical protein